MQYHVNPDEMLAVTRERHQQLLREATLLQHIARTRPARQPSSKRMVALVQRLAHTGWQCWMQARTVFKLAPAE